VEQPARTTDQTSRGETLWYRYWNPHYTEPVRKGLATAREFISAQTAPVSGDGATRIANAARDTFSDGLQ
jgi:hypothetical protein